MENANELAFPATHSWRDEQPQILTYSGGLTKREYIAALALQGLLSTESIGASGYPAEEVAKKAIYYTDELLKQLEE